MTQKTLSGLIFTLIISITMFSVAANDHAAKSQIVSTSDGGNMKAIADQGESAKKIPVYPESHSATPPAKTHAPQMEELPHVHKFHKERVKKIKKHHGKYWLLSQLVIVICHLSILLIAYLHATH